MKSRNRVKAALDDEGRVTRMVKGVRVTIVKRGGKYELAVEEKGEKPDQWVYRRERIAIDRFEELCDTYRRGP